MLSHFDGDVDALDLGHEVQYTLAGKTPSSGKVSAENVKKLRKGTISPHTIDAEIYEGIVVRPLRNVNPDQAQYAGLVKIGSDSKFQLTKFIVYLLTFIEVIWDLICFPIHFYLLLLGQWFFLPVYWQFWPEKPKFSQFFSLKKKQN